MIVASTAAAVDEDSIAARGRRNRRRCTMVKSEAPTVPSPAASNRKRKRTVKSKSQAKTSQAGKAPKAKAPKAVKQDQMRTQKQLVQQPAKKQKPTKTQDIRGFFAAGKAAGKVAATAAPGKTEKAATRQGDIRSFFAGK